MISVSLLGPCGSYKVSISLTLVIRWSFYLGVKRCGTNFEQTFFMLRTSCTVLCNIPIERAKMSARSCIFIWGPSSKAWLTRLTFCSLQATTGAPDRGSSWKSILPFWIFSSIWKRYFRNRQMPKTLSVTPHGWILSFGYTAWVYKCSNKDSLFQPPSFLPECARLVCFDVTARYTKCDVTNCFTYF